VSFASQNKRLAGNGAVAGGAAASSAMAGGVVVDETVAGGAAAGTVGGVAWNAIAGRSGRSSRLSIGLRNWKTGTVGV
jgi:hypothetical protein